jgi:hypothetical protein
MTVQSQQTRNWASARADVNMYPAGRSLLCQTVCPGKNGVENKVRNTGIRQRYVRFQFVAKERNFLISQRSARAAAINGRTDTSAAGTNVSDRPAYQSPDCVSEL